MLIPTMNDVEKRKQAIEDTYEVDKYVTYNLYYKLRKDVRKFSKFPRLFKTTYTTKNRNKYYLICRAKSRTTFDTPFWVHVYTIMDSNEGKYAMIAVSQHGVIETFQIYAPHLFTRYTERYGVNMYEEERIHRFMTDSASPLYGGVKEYEKGKMMAVVNGGVILGDKEGDIIVFKTFVDNDRLREEQIEIGEKTQKAFAKRLELFKTIFG